MNKRQAAIPFLTAFLAVNAYAGTDAELERLLLLSMENLLTLKVKVSTNTDQTLSKAPSVVSVITAEDIQATGATNLTEILQSVPGIYIRTNLFGSRPHVTFRGALPSSTLLMVNGEAIKDLMWTSGIFWKGLPISMIERVEIIRGPGSALFGSDASAGVINVITKSAGPIRQAKVGLRAGQFDSQAGWVEHGGNWNGFDIGFTAELSHSNGHNPFIAQDAQLISGNAQYGHDGQDIRFSMARNNWRLLADHTGQSDIGIGLAGAGVLDPLTRGSSSRDDIALLYSNDEFAQNWGLNAELRYNHLDYTSGDGFQERPAGYVDVTDPLNPVTYPDGQINQMRSGERGYRAEISGLYTGIKKHAIRVGGGYSLKDLYRVEQSVNYFTGPNGEAVGPRLSMANISDTPDAFTPEKIRRVSYLFVQDIWTLAYDWELTAGARYDNYSDFGGTLNPRAALVWQSTDRLTTKLMYGEAFRVPSYLELFGKTAATKANPTLTPEKSHTWDLSFSYLAAKNLKFGLDLYQFVQTNRIAADAANKYQNSLGDRTARGIELEAQWQATKTLRLAGNLSHINEDAATFPRSIPKQKAYLRTDWAFLPKWNWNLQANWIGKREANGGRAPLDAYTLVDTTLRHIPRKNWEFAASIRNLFDADAREYSSSALPDNLPLARRSFHAELIYKF